MKIRSDDQKRFVIGIISLMCWINHAVIGKVGINTGGASSDTDYWPHQILA